MRGLLCSSMWAGGRAGEPGAASQGGQQPGGQDLVCAEPWQGWGLWVLVGADAGSSAGGAGGALQGQGVHQQANQQSWIPMEVPLL